MTVLKKKLGERIKGSLAENEDWWHLCFDTETHDLFVMHESSYLNRAAFKTESSSTRVSIQDFIEMKMPGHEKLTALIEGLFDA